MRLPALRHLAPFTAAATLALAGCNSSSTSSPHYTSTGAAPTWTIATDIGVNDPVVIRFDESIATGSLSLSGSLAESVGARTWSRSSGSDDTLTLTPPADGWTSGMQDLSVSVQDRDGHVALTTTRFAVRLKFDDFQPASVVIGQKDFIGKAANQGGTAAADTLFNPTGDPLVIDGRLWIADSSNNRVLGYEGIPAANGASASWVIGQSNFTDSGSGTSALALSLPYNVAYDGSSFYVSDSGNSRVLVYDGVPLSAPGTASHVTGQADLNSATTGCAAGALQYPDTTVAVAGKLIVSDSGNSRVLIWKSAPTNADDVAPDLVLGQSDFTHCTARDDNQDGSIDAALTARTMEYPGGIWSDGTRLLVVDSEANRVLLWNTFPTSSFQPADVVIGHSDFNRDSARDDNEDNFPDIPASARTFYLPTRVWSNGLQIFVTDRRNNRVLVWNNFPTSNFQPADVVLGQSTFAGWTANDDDQNNAADATPSARTLNTPFGIGVYRNRLLVGDLGNHRVLVFASK